MTATEQITDQIVLEVDDQIITGYFKFMSPELAMSYMVGNVHNRNLRPNHLRKIVDDLSNNTFKFNGAAILVADDGTLIDGQHRLQAIIDSGVGVWLLVLRGFRLETQDTVDTGAKRLLGDVLHLRGEKNYNELAATLKVAASWEQGNRERLNQREFSHQQLIAFLDHNPDVRDSLTPVRPFAQRYGLSKSHMSLAWWVLNRLNSEDNAEFWQLLMQPQQPPHPIAALQSSLMNDIAARARGHRRVPLHQLAVVFKTWNFYVAGQTALQIRHKVGGANPDRFPEPMAPIS
jgi:hypothetical protein